MKDKVYAGIDVSKDWLDANWGREKRLKNTSKGVKQLAEKLAKEAITLVVVESTGGYERALVEALLVAKVPVAVV